MQKTISVQLNELQSMSVGALREKYEELFKEASRSRNKQNLIKRIAYRMQEQLEGSLSERARKRAAELADEAHIHLRTPPGAQGADAPVKVATQVKRDPRLPAAGTVLVRELDGKRHEVTIRERDVLYAGKSYRSLSRVARAISGTPWNGFRFFALTSEEKK
jgi:DNA-binding transcriptional regulator YbjK